MNERTLTQEDIFNSLVFIRDHIVTDENIQSVKDVISQMTQLLKSVYVAVKKTPLDAENVYQEAQNREMDIETYDMLNPLFEQDENPLWNYISQQISEEDEEEMSRGVSVDGLLDVVAFIKDHIVIVDNIMTTLSTLFTSLQDIQSSNESILDIPSDEIEEVKEQVQDDDVSEKSDTSEHVEDSDDEQTVSESEEDTEKESMSRSLQQSPTDLYKELRSL